MEQNLANLFSYTCVYLQFHVNMAAVNPHPEIQSLASLEFQIWILDTTPRLNPIS